ncbi:MAG: radical SAM protein [Pseudomonadota bacterium]
MSEVYDLVIIDPLVETNYPKHTKNNINVGILSIASYVYNNGYKVKLLDFQHEKNFLSELLDFVKNNTVKIIAINCTSSFSYGSLMTAVKALSDFKETLVIVGGQHVIGLRENVFSQIPELKYACFDEGESTVLHLIRNFPDSDYLNSPGLVYKSNNKIVVNPPKSLSFEQLGSLNYKLLNNYSQKIPTVEESRGCPFRCNFCVNSDSKQKIKIKKWQNVIAEILEVYKLYNEEKLFVNIGCSTFGMDESNTLKLLENLIPHKDKLLIQAYTRCDINYEKWIEYLKQLDITSVYFGVESASEEILLRMNKTRNPKEYLCRSQELIDLFYENGVKLWCNFIIGYIGETPETLSKTIEFILKNKKKIGFLTCSALYAFPGAEIFRNLKHYEKKYGTSISLADSNLEWDHLKINPSFDFSYKQMFALSKILPKIVNSEEDFMRVYSWRWQGLDKDLTQLDKKMNYMDKTELPYALFNK